MNHNLHFACHIYGCLYYCVYIVAGLDLAIPAMTVVAPAPPTRAVKSPTTSGMVSAWR